MRLLLITVTISVIFIESKVAGVRCSRDDISFSGLVRPRKRYFQPNERLNPSCQYGYYLTKDNNILTCVNGTWTGHFPPCTPAPCKLENLYQQEGMSPDNEGVVLNGISAQVKCKKGFTRSEYQAVCSRREWAVSGKLCKESSCIILQISNGAFTKAVEKKKWTFLSYDRWTEYEKISLGRTINPGSSVHVSCDAGYSFQGKGRNDVSVKCSFGEWDKDPVCLVTGAPYNKKAETTSDKSLAQTTTLTSTRIPFTIPVSEMSVPKSSESQPTLQPTCFCTYASFDKNLEAFIGTELLQNGSKVENGNAVKFFCQLFGYLRLQGPAEILCQECHWQTSKFPECAPPKTGETTVLINGDWKLLPEGTVAIQKGKTVSIQCDAKGVELIPQWIIPEASNINVESYQDYYTGRNVSVLYIWKTDIEHTGKYQCFVPGYVPYNIYIEVTADPVAARCQKLEDDDLLIEYNNEQFVNSSAVFSCKGSNQTLVGSRVLTCMPDGRWSSDKPECKKLCPKIPQTEGIIISYTSDQNIGSIAAFYCLPHHVRTGVSHTTCKQNGEWKDPIPTCTLQTCLVDSLFKIVPENVVPDVETVPSENVPFNSTITLTCEKGWNLNGPNKAKCGPNGEWQVSKVKCVTGCPYPVSTQDSDLIIDPNRDQYRLGELVTLSCPAGQILSSEVVRLLCLNNGWSQNDLPHCINE